MTWPARIRTIIAARRGALYHIAGAAVVLFVWRFMSLPSPDTYGLLIPFAWLLTGLIYGKGGIPRYSLMLLSCYLLISVFWTAGPVPALLASAVALAGILPGLLACAKTRKHGYLLALIPILPIVVLEVPFVHDEPFYATITEDFVSPGRGLFGNMDSSLGNPSVEVRHHQPLYPGLLIPGYFKGQTGVRLMNVLMAFAAAFLLGRVFKRENLWGWQLLVFLGFMTVPGIGTFGIVYPEWLAVLVFCIGILLLDKKFGLLWMILVTVLLVFIKERFAPLGAGLILLWILSKPRKIKYMALMLSAGVLLVIFLLDVFAFSGRLLIVRYGNMPFVKTVLSNIVLLLPMTLFNVLSSLIDIESGLLWRAPWIILALAGLPELKRRHPRAYRTLGLPALLYVAAVFLWKQADWHSLPTPCGRMLTPMLPVLLAGLSMKLRSKPARLFIALSLAVSILHIVSPGLRFNDADGTDILFSLLLGPDSSFSSFVPSFIRPEFLPYLAWSLIAAALVWLTAKNRKGAAAILVGAAIIVGAGVSRPLTSWEAEDLSGDHLDCCRLYPENKDILLRKFWLGSKEMMLLMQDPEDMIHLPVPDFGSDSVLVRIRCRTRPSPENLSGLYVTCGDESDSVSLSSELISLPLWSTIIKSEGLTLFPENGTELIAEFTFPDPGTGSEIFIHCYGDPIFLDRIELERK